jgi:hypothetical protein
LLYFAPSEAQCQINGTGFPLPGIRYRSSTSECMRVRARFCLLLLVAFFGPSRYSFRHPDDCSRTSQFREFAA